jgi:hypothetical protein
MKGFMVDSSEIWNGLFYTLSKNGQSP